MVFKSDLEMIIDAFLSSYLHYFNSVYTGLSSPLWIAYKESKIWLRGYTYFIIFALAPHMVQTLRSLEITLRALHGHISAYINKLLHLCTN